MATNPMQRRSRNSFLLGMLLMLLIAGTIAGIVIYMLTSEVAKLKKAKEEIKQVYILATNVKSGEIIIDDMLIRKEVSASAIPANAFYVGSSINEFSLKDKKTGSHIGYIQAQDTTTGVSGESYLYLLENDKRVLIEHDFTTDAYYRYKANNADILVGSDDSTYLYVSGNQGNQAIITRNGEDFYYNNGKLNVTKEQVEFLNQPMIAKININANTVITYDMLTELDEASSDDLRIQEFNMFSLPVKLSPEDYIDIRLTLPNGLDYIVASKKRVLDVQEDTIWLKVSEQEILTLSNAIVEAYIMTGSKLTVTLFVEPGLQAAAIPTYAVSEEVYKLIQLDPNIVQTAKDELRQRFSPTGGNLESQRTNDINGQIRLYADEAQENVEESVKAEIEARKSLREKYIEQLTATTSIEY